MAQLVSEESCVAPGDPLPMPRTVKNANLGLYQMRVLHSENANLGLYMVKRQPLCRQTPAKLVVIFYFLQDDTARHLKYQNLAMQPTSNHSEGEKSGSGDEETAEGQPKSDSETTLDASEAGWLERVSLLEKAVGENEIESLLPGDTYSFFATKKYFRRFPSAQDSPVMYWPTRAFVIALFLFFFQLVTLALLWADIFDRESPDNKLGIPPGIDLTVRFSQLIAISIAVISQSEVRQSLHILYRGFDKDAQKKALQNDPDQTNGQEVPSESEMQLKWYLSIALRLFNGSLGLAVTFMMIMREETVRDVLLNFTAVEFVSTVDDTVFTLANMGYMGKALRRDTETVNNTKPTEEETEDKSKVKEFFMFGCMMFIYFTLFGFWLWLARRQNDGELRSKNIYVQFGDDFSADLATFSGLYAFDPPKSLIRGERSQYLLSNSGRFNNAARFAYCERSQTWTFSYDRDSGWGDPCDSPLVESSQSLSYEITDLAFGTWFFHDPTSFRTLPLQRFSMRNQEEFVNKRCSFPDDCGDATRFDCIDRKCACATGWFGLSCHFREPCAKVETDERFGPFDRNRHWNPKLEIVNDRVSGRPIQVYNRPVYTDTGKGDGFDLLIFTGRRWEVLERPNILREDGSFFNHSSIQSSSLSGEFHGFWSDYESIFISDPVDILTPTDLATPVGLRWHRARPTTQDSGGNTIRPSHDNRAIEAVLICASCGEHNPCFHEGECNKDEKCECRHGAGGALCQVAPVKNGKCDPFFNKGEFGFDGGDCCQVTCTNSSEFKCGHDDSEYVGFCCKDPKYESVDMTNGTACNDQSNDAEGRPPEGRPPPEGKPPPQGGPPDGP